MHAKQRQQIRVRLSATCALTAASSLDRSSRKRACMIESNVTFWMKITCHFNPLQHSIVKEVLTCNIFYKQTFITNFSANKLRSPLTLCEVSAHRQQVQEPWTSSTQLLVLLFSCQIDPMFPQALRLSTSQDAPQCAVWPPLSPLPLQPASSSGLTCLLHTEMNDLVTLSCKIEFTRECRQRVSVFKVRHTVIICTPTMDASAHK